MEGKHIPGPWEVKEIRWDNGRLISRNVCRGQLPIASISNNHEANAQLIAAAPDLLKAAKELLSVLGPNGYFPSAGFTKTEALRAAIAKAES